MANTKTQENKYVRIQSTMTINVTAGLQAKDVTNPDAHVPDRLKVQPLWPKTTVLIKEGAHMYPAEITTWRTVKALEAKGILTIGAYSDTCDDPAVEESAKKLDTNIKEVKKNEFRLEDIAKE